MNAKYRYCILPDGNSSEFPGLDAELKRRGVRADYSPMEAGGRIYRVPREDLPLMPRDEKGPYLGDDNSGHSLWHAKTPWAEDYRKSVRGAEWRKVWGWQ